MGYLIFNTDRDDEMQSVRHNMRRMMRGGGYSPMMRHEEDTGFLAFEKAKSYFDYLKS